MGYCFMDIKKIKSLNVMAAKYKHNYREITVPNAVPELSGMNRELVPLIGKDGNPVDYNEAFKQKMESLEYYKDHKQCSPGIRDRYYLLPRGRRKGRCREMAGGQCEMVKRHLQPDS